MKIPESFSSDKVTIHFIVWKFGHVKNIKIIDYEI